MSGIILKRYRGVVDLEREVSVDRPTVYVYEAAVRIWHWLHALAVLVLVVTGYLIASPPPTLSGEASAHFQFGYIRFTHFSAGYVLAITFIGRMLWAFVGNRHSRQIFYLPVWDITWWRGVLWEIRWYAFLAPEPKKYLAHNPLAQISMFFAVTVGTVGMVLTGFALYSEGTGRDSWQARLFGWVFTFVPNSQDVHTMHHLGMWVVVVFTIVHIYAAVREEIMSRQTTIATMISGERQFRDERDD